VITGCGVMKMMCVMEKENVLEQIEIVLLHWNVLHLHVLKALIFVNIIMMIVLVK